MSNPCMNYTRIQSLDFLRGVAILGILLINIESFAYPKPWSPSAFGFASEADRAVRFGVYWLAQGKFYFMLTILFGVGFTLFLQRAKEKHGVRAYPLYFKRLFWLFILGLVHAYFIWDGDILYHYAVCGALLLLFEPFNGKHLGLIIAALLAVLVFNALQRTAERAESLEKYHTILQTPVEARTPDEQTHVKQWQTRLKKRDAEAVAAEQIRPTYLSSIQANFAQVKVHQGVIYHQSILYRTLIMMLVGVLLYRSGIFQDYRAVRHYGWITLGVCLAALLMNFYRYHHWTYHYEQPVVEWWRGLLFSFPRESLALAYVLLFNGLYQTFGRGRLSGLVAHVGRMALSNYIGQSIVCGLLFYGYGLGLHNQLSRWQLLPIVLGLGLMQLLISGLWLRRHSAGPLEALWRRLIYRGQVRAEKPLKQDG